MPTRSGAAAGARQCPVVASDGGRRLAAAARPATERPWRGVLGGVNLAGGEFGQDHLPGEHGVHYVYPTRSEVEHFARQGMRLFRLPFRWERLQPQICGGLETRELARLDELVAAVTATGSWAVLDLHNFARYHGAVLGEGIAPSVLADFWGRLAAHYRGWPRVVLGLMNEPHDLPTEIWLEAANAAIAAVRMVGATNLVLVPGNGWTGAAGWSDDWYGTPNDEAMLGVRDPIGHFAYEIHLYFDHDSSGTHEECESSTIGSERLRDVTAWLRRHGRRALLAEVGAGTAAICRAGLDDLLTTVAAHADVWLGWCYWAAGPWWGEDYFLSIEPIRGHDRPQMDVLRRHL